MRNRLAFIVLVGLSGPGAAAQDVDALSQEGKMLIQEFAGALKKELLAAVDSGGPANAVSVCKIRAPQIAHEVSEKNGGWMVARSSHGLRNPENAPDDYTAEAIAAFLERAAAGEPVADLVKAEIVEEEGESVFRMVKAIPTGKLCLACHGGSEVTEEVDGLLKELYPEDDARNFAEGDLRGVFTLQKRLGSNGH